MEGNDDTMNLDEIYAMMQTTKKLDTWYSIPLKVENTERRLKTVEN